MTRRRRLRVGRGPRLYGTVVVWLRVPLLLVWLVVAGLAVVHLPSFGSSSGPVVQLIPGNAPALRALATSLRIFKVPAGSEFAVVVRDPGGLSAGAHAAVFSQALAVDRRATQEGSRPAFALPLVDTLRLVPGSRESGTTAVTFLYYPQSMPVNAQIASAHRYAGCAGTGDRAASGADGRGAWPGRAGSPDRPRSEPDRFAHGGADHRDCGGQLSLVGGAAGADGGDRRCLPDHAGGTQPVEPQVRYRRSSGA